MKPLLRSLITLSIVVAACLLIAALWRAYVLAPWTRDGRVSAEVVQIMPEVSGTVAEVSVKDNQFVHRGDVLYRLDPLRFRLAVASAEAEMEKRHAEVALKASTAKRRNQLGSDVISAETIDLANGEAKIAKAAYDSAVAALDVARLNLDRATIKAPVDGYVTNFRLRTGDYATAGATKVSIVDSSSFWVTGYFEETKLAKIAPGKSADIHLMGFDAAVRGHVSSIGRGIADANDNPDHRGLQSVNPVFTWVRLAQRIPVRIQIDHIPDGVTLSAGMTCSIAVGDELPKGRLEALSRKFL
ncbi:HlyD family secretion protein [Cupriavidus metallidurans]|uniref:HlyD family secretion protein n=1 Tax=Cupriavidus metallidurans TaxID=119219 RepID=A0A482IYR4_9BURK|nr:HlyD family secretion protein [Cupriavidus metallidurans]QBP12527.1 HlyD family secretion protein [Cupriavidus metallidurans]